jgi:hypothetical protein
MYSPRAKIALLVRVDAGFIDDATSRIRALDRKFGKNMQQSEKPIHIARI